MRKVLLSVFEGKTQNKIAIKIDGVAVFKTSFPKQNPKNQRKNIYSATLQGLRAVRNHLKINDKLVIETQNGFMKRLADSAKYSPDGFSEREKQELHKTLRMLFCEEIVFTQNNHPFAEIMEGEEENKTERLETSVFF